MPLTPALVNTAPASLGPVSVPSSLGRTGRFAPGPDAQVDWSHPLARNLVSACIPGRDVARGLSASWSAAITCESMTTDGVLYPNGIAFPKVSHINVSSGDFTVSTWCRIPSNAVWVGGTPYGPIFSVRTYDANTPGEYGIFIGSDGVVNGLDVGGGFSVGTASGSFDVSGAWQLITMRRIGSAVRVLQGVTLRSSTTMANVSSNIPGAMTLGSIWNAFVVRLVQYGMFAIWTRGLSDVELSSLTTNPFQMFTTPARQIEQVQKLPLHSHGTLLLNGDGRGIS